MITETHDFAIKYVFIDKNTPYLSLDTKLYNMKAYFCICRIKKEISKNIYVTIFHSPFGGRWNIMTIDDGEIKVKLFLQCYNYEVIIKQLLDLFSLRLISQVIWLSK